MKNFMLFCTFITNVLFMNAQQDFICATPPEGTITGQSGFYSFADEITTLESFPSVVFNVFFWGINKSGE